ncbi:MAG: hypothetical protein FWD82_09390 [Defluviitaleaceae bacterium]|nr:hypothetical protein [Defluviitaleaceae bacterium]
MAKLVPEPDGSIKEIKPNQIGQLFTRKELGIKPQDLHKGTVGDYMFFTINNENYSNELHRDGIVYQPKDSKDLVPGSENCPPGNGLNLKNKRILVRFCDTGQAAFEFIGIATSIVRYDQTRNKIFMK